jgi:SAM-dependent methyltransferase
MRSGAIVQGGIRPAAYHTQSRPDVAALVPPECWRVLDVGCGAGASGALLRQRGHHVTGVELLPDVAAQARRALDVVVTTDVDSAGLPFPPNSFDAILFADVLEHFVDPWRVVRQAARLLAPDGVVVASIPNVQYFGVVRGLVRGRWDYRERGILDRGHLRFFTLATIRQMFDQAGLHVTHVDANYRRTWLRGLLTFVTAGWARAFLTRQYLVVGRHARHCGNLPVE